LRAAQVAARPLANLGFGLRVLLVCGENAAEDSWRLEVSGSHLSSDGSGSGD
jgi:hypothetical protein